MAVADKVPGRNRCTARFLSDQTWCMQQQLQLSKGLGEEEDHDVGTTSMKLGRSRKHADKRLSLRSTSLATIANIS
jgi:hypothetical protein